MIYKCFLLFRIYLKLQSFFYLHCCSDILAEPFLVVLPETEPFLFVGVDYLSAAAYDDLVPAHLAFHENRVRKCVLDDLLVFEISTQLG